MSETTASVGAWVDSDYVESWVAADGLAGLLELPWRAAGLLTGLDRSPDLVVDLGSGPGTFLKEFLALYPDARGVWVDASAAMREQAEQTLAEFGDRVSYVLGDVSTLSDLDLPHGADVVTNSRVAHHFDPAGLVRFYGACFDLLAPGGWAVTLDHIRPSEQWNARLRAVLPRFAGPNAGRPTHPHYFPFPSVDEHLSSLTAVGFTEVEMPWRAFYTCLFMGQRPGSGAPR